MSDFIGIFTNNMYICIGKNYLIPYNCKITALNYE